ncbi:pyridoxamine 5'-phosphate oxidase family protein [Streptomyces sp. A7024]|uniref:Pyridoxamine 5'-phosphate oxidase family protein n=1 Tax=Streptomyces coryli TaxID=1128680 RepID=A0A6G4TWF7_9ACTN|nr:pyridoxamine 5'-phosphate oxidase family protein [Streptomyces coryli]
MAATQVQSFADIEAEFNRYISDIVYCSLITVDRKGRPRARVLLPVWEVVDGRPVGWLAAFSTPVKMAHIKNNPHVTCSYWNPRQNCVFLDCEAEWVEDQEVKRQAWELYREGSPAGVGYDPRRYWPEGPTDAGYELLRMDPFRVQVVRGRDLQSKIWQP